MATTKKSGQQGFASMDEEKRKAAAKKGGESSGNSRSSKSENLDKDNNDSKGRKK